MIIVSLKEFFDLYVTLCQTPILSGQIILAPGESISVYIGGFLPVSFNGIRFAFGWWEEKIKNCNNYCC
ncbi:MAG: hypothetical protein MSH12_04195 [Romboutsia timonensis]|nr:hypothetical protein [Romboutsia timonensis]